MTVFHNMSQASRAEPLTRYLVFKVAIQVQDQQLASECLEIVSQACVSDQNILHACILEVQRAGDKVCAIAASQVVRIFTSCLELINRSQPHGDLLLRELCSEFVIAVGLTALARIQDDL
jgi:hypothetical protein